LAVGLRAEFHPADVAHPRHVAVRSRLYDDGTELVGVVKTTRHLDRILERLPFRGRRRADLARGDLLALLLQSLHYILRGQAPRLHLLGVEPDTHGILPGPENADASDAGQTRDFVLQAYGRVVA